jgi:subtilisin-like proprotein convertase family protein
MKTLFLALWLALVVSVNATTTLYPSGTLNATIPDGNVSGYQNTINVVDGRPSPWVTDVNVKLNISGGYNGDLYVYLSHGSGFSVLLNRVGRTAGDSFGYSDAGFNITLDDSAASDIHNYGGNGGAQLTGTWQPDARNVDPATVLNTSTRNAHLSSFNNLDPNGAWTLFVADMSSGDQSMLVSWELEITAVPEPAHIALGIFGFGLVGLQGCRWWMRRRTAATA